MSLLEFIIAMMLMSVVGIIAINITSQTQKNNIEKYEENLVLIDLASSYNILYNRAINNQSTDLVYKNNALFLNDELFLENVVKYTKNTNAIEICLETKTKICQTWDLVNE